MEARVSLLSDTGAKTMLTKESMGPAHREASFRMAELRVETRKDVEASEFGEATLIFRLLVWYDNILLLRN